MRVSSRALGSGAHRVQDGPTLPVLWLTEGHSPSLDLSFQLRTPLRGVSVPKSPLEAERTTEVSELSPSWAVSWSGGRRGRSQIKHRPFGNGRRVLGFLLGSHPHGHAHCPDKALVIVLRLLDRLTSTGVRGRGGERRRQREREIEEPGKKAIQEEPRGKSSARLCNPGWVLCLLG